MKKFIVRLIALTALALIYCCTLAVCFLAKWSKIRTHKQRRIIINGTFHNPNWFFSHIEPIARSNYGEVILVCDEPVADLPNLTYKCPPKWAKALFTRAGAKFIWTLSCGIKYPANIYIGYHIFPSAITALFCARILGSKAIYQVTSGELELEGGGWNSENTLLRSLGKPSKWIEKLAVSIANQFDITVVRGSKAKAFLVNAGNTNRIEIVTGSVEVDQTLFQPLENRDIDVILVGRLTEYKRPDRFIHIAKLVSNQLPNLNCAIVGEGPDRDKLEKLVHNLDMKNQIKFLGQRSDVTTLIGRAKIFVLTSRWEGVSIAMLEAMAMGAVPVVYNVGDLEDFVTVETGFIFPEGQHEAFSAAIIKLLQDQTLYTRLQKNGSSLIVENCSRSAMSQRWLNLFYKLTDNQPPLKTEKK